MTIDRDYRNFIAFELGDGLKLKGFSAASRAKTTAIKIELELSDEYELARLMERLAEGRAWQNTPKPKCPAPQQDELRRLPAPRLMITDGRSK